MTISAKEPCETASAGDFVITYHGIVVTIDVLTDACFSWMEENVEIEPWQRLSKRRVGIDPSVAEELREALVAAGFSDGEAIQQPSPRG